MPIYTIIAGVNGSGKSSFTGSLKYQRHDLGRVIDVDRLAREHGGRIAGGRAAILLQRSCIERGLSFTQETTLSGQRTLEMIKKAKAEGYYIRLCYIGISTPEEALRRIQNRVSKGGHDIKAEDVYRRFATRSECVARVLDLCDEVAFFDNENGFVEVASYENGELARRGDYCPEWLRELEEYLKPA